MVVVLSFFQMQVLFHIVNLGDRVNLGHGSLYWAVKYCLNRSSKLSFKSSSLTSGITGHPSSVSSCRYLSRAPDLLPDLLPDFVPDPSPCGRLVGSDGWEQAGVSFVPLSMGSSSDLTYSISFNWIAVVSSSCMSMNERRCFPTCTAISSCLHTYCRVSSGPTRESGDLHFHINLAMFHSICIECHC